MLITYCKYKYVFKLEKWKTEADFLDQWQQHLTFR